MIESDTQLLLIGVGIIVGIASLFITLITIAARLGSKMEKQTGEIIGINSRLDAQLEAQGFLNNIIFGRLRDLDKAIRREVPGGGSNGGKQEDLDEIGVEHNELDDFTIGGPGERTGDGPGPGDTYSTESGSGSETHPGGSGED